MGWSEKLSQEHGPSRRSGEPEELDESDVPDDDEEFPEVPDAEDSLDQFDDDDGDDDELLDTDESEESEVELVTELDDEDDMLEVDEVLEDDEDEDDVKASDEDDEELSGELLDELADSEDEGLVLEVDDKLLLDPAEAEEVDDRLLLDPAEAEEVELPEGPLLSLDDGSVPEEPELVGGGEAELSDDPADEPELIPPDEPLEVDDRLLLDPAEAEEVELPEGPLLSLDDGSGPEDPELAGGGEVELSDDPAEEAELIPPEELLEVDDRLLLDPAEAEEFKLDSELSLELAEELLVEESLAEESDDQKNESLLLSFGIAQSFRGETSVLSSPS